MESGENMKAANETYGGFTHMVKWGTIAVVVIVAIVVALIS